MLTQRCKVCGGRHHRYEPHRFPAEPSQASPAAGSTPRSPSRRNQDKGEAEPTAQATHQQILVAPQPASLGTSDTPPSQLSSMLNNMLNTILSLDDKEFHLIFNAVSRERMRRWRKPKR